MSILVLGIILFLGVHSLTTFRVFRAGLIARAGEGAYKGLYSIVALLGFVLIVWGFARYRADGLIPVYTPVAGARHLTLSLMWFAFVALACSNPAPGRIRGWLRHPMLIAIMIWALAHLLANGDLGALVLFGSFLIWAIYDRIAVGWRGDEGATPQTSFSRSDALALGVGSIAYAVMIFLHPFLIGVPVVNM